MPKGRRGEKRPADAVARAIMVAKICGEIEDKTDPLQSAPAELGRKGAGPARPKCHRNDERKLLAGRLRSAGRNRSLRHVMFSGII